ncbi:MAG: hypothetical protein Tsb0014_12720 [Pleurocapsa sp.]
MLPYALAIAVGLSSLILFTTAFLMSDIHRQDDFFWSGVGLFYALVLWFCATRITGGLLLGQVAAVALVVSNNWQTIKLRKAIVNPEAAAKLNQFSVLSLLGGVLSRKKSPSPATQPVTTETPKVTEQPVAIPEQPSQETTTTPQEQDSLSTPVTEPKNTTTQDSKQAKTNLFGKLFGRKKPPVAASETKKDETTITNTKLNDIFDGAEVIDTQEVIQDKEKSPSEATTTETEVITEPKSQESAEETKTDKEAEVIAESKSQESVEETKTDKETDTSSVDKVTTPESPTVATNPAKTSPVSESIEIIDVKIEETTIESPSTPTGDRNPTPETPEVKTASSPPPESIQDSSPAEQTTTSETTEEDTSDRSNDASKTPSPELDIDEFLDEIERKPDKPSDPS